MTTTDNRWQTHAARLADQLLVSGDITDPQWAAAIAAIPRHVLVPKAYQQQPDGTWSQIDEHLELTYSPTTLVTALDDGQAVSSSTKPDLMIRMLETLHLQDGDRVLEIGTGTGYNAALLSHRLGEDNVYSIDMDPTLVAHAWYDQDSAIHVWKQRGRGGRCIDIKIDSSTTRRNCNLCVTYRFACYHQWCRLRGCHQSREEQRRTCDGTSPRQ